MKNILNKLLCLSLVSLFYVQTAYADVSRTCFIRAYAVTKGDNGSANSRVDLFNISAKSTAGTANKARKEARDKLINCGRDIWEARWDNFGKLDSAVTVPKSCQDADISGLHTDELDVKKRLLNQACAVWSTLENSDLNVAVMLVTRGDIYCDDYNGVIQDQWMERLSESYKIKHEDCPQRAPMRN